LAGQHSVGSNHFPAFKDIVAAGFFDQDVLAGLAGPYSGKGVPALLHGMDFDANNLLRFERSVNL